MGAEVWVVATDTDDQRACRITGVFSTREKAVAACRTQRDAVVKFEVDLDKFGVDDLSDWDYAYPLRSA